MQPGKRIFATLDGVRGVAATAIVVAHTQAFFGTEMGTELFLAVDLFFILSGAVIANAYEERLRSELTVLDFAKIRLIRFYPLYILGSAIGLLAMMLGFSWYKEAGYIPLTVSLAILMLPNPFVVATFPLNPPAWSLFFELFVNIVYAAALAFLTPRVLSAIMAVSALGMAGIVYFVGPDPGFNIGWSIENLYGGFFRVGYSFFAGVLLYRFFSSKKSAQNRDRSGGVISWIILGVVAMMLCARPPASIRPYYEFAAVILLCPAIVYSGLWFEPGRLGAKLCRFCGSVSYAIYAIHVPLFWLVEVVTVKITGFPGKTWAPWAGFCFVGGLLLFCWVLDKCYDAPLRRFLLARGAPKIAALPQKPGRAPPEIVR